MRRLLVYIAALFVAASPAQAAELRVLSGNGAKAAVQELCKQFERATGNTIKLHFEVNADLKKKIEAGEAFDVAVLNPPVIDALIKDGRLIAGSRADIGRSGLGLAVRTGTPKPDISWVDAFKRTLLAAKAVAYPGKGASGLYFVSLLDRLGIKAGMQGKLKPMEAEDTVEVVARGEAAMGVVVVARGVRHGCSGGDAHYRSAWRRFGRADSGGTADKDRIFCRIERFREGARGGAGAEPFPHRTRSRADPQSKWRRSGLIHACVARSALSVRGLCGRSLP